MSWRRLEALTLCWEKLIGDRQKLPLTTEDTEDTEFERMKFSEQFEARFSEMLTHYPTKRSVLVPTLLYAQDETGYLSDEVIEELAGRLELTALEVRNVISYYSMLTTKPRGKYNVQVCTNIACMLRGGEELLEHCEKKLGVGHKGTTPDGLFSLEEVECIGGCSWAPAVQVNYDFHENLTTEKMDKVLDGYAKKGA
jgi:NADH-quinone oxidoreductase subunit E